MFEFCGQGEPLNNPDFASLCRLINEFFPSARVTLITNANFNALQKLKGCRLDEITVSCDGAEQITYEIFRVNGNFKSCIEFIQSSRALFPQANLIWKYIVFNHNDTDSELIHAQNLAEQLGVDRLNFICTQYGPISERFTQAEPDNFPLVSQKAVLQIHPYVRNMLAVTTVEKRGLSDLPQRYNFVYGSKEPFEHHIDRVSLAFYQEQYYLYIDGWCVPQNRGMKIFLKLGAYSRNLQLVFKREDVSRAYQYPYASGFRSVFPLGASKPENKQLVQIGTHLFSSTYVFDYEASFTENTLEHDPLVFPMKFLRKPTKNS